MALFLQPNRGWANVQALAAESGRGLGTEASEAREAGLALLYLNFRSFGSPRFEL